MTPEDFVASFETVTETKGGIKKLREMILDLAMRGKIVAQDPNDEPASRLLSRLRAAPVKGRVQQVPTTAIVPPYDIDDSWQWCHFTDVVSIEARLVDPADYLNLPHVAPDNIEKGTGRLLRYNTIGQDGVTSSKQRFYPGQILYSKIRPNLSKVVIVDFDGLCSADMYPLVPKIDARFLHLFMLSPEFLKQVVRDDNRLAMPKVNQQQLSETVVAVPPLQEQKRIVAKVDQLMALCDDLEARQAKKRETAVRLNRAALDALTSAEGPEEVAASFRRIAENFEALAHTVESIKELRRTILDLAIRGRLVPQNSSNAEDPATSARLFEACRLEFVAFQIPRSWSWQTLASLIDPAYPISYGVLVPGPEVEDGVPFVRIQDLNAQNPTAAPAKRIAADIEAQYARTRLVGGELLLAVVGTIGKLGIVPDSWRGANIARAVCRIMPQFSVVELGYLKLFLQSNFAQRCFAQATRTLAQPTLNVGALRETPVPLPPLAEQKRIVAKVDQLMALCDTLEAALRRAESTAQKLAEAVVAEIVA